jgi:hypothetical protein
MRIHYAQDTYSEIIDMTRAHLESQYATTDIFGRDITEDERSRLVEEEIAMLFGVAVAAETILQGDMLALNPAGQLVKADKDNPAKVNFIGISTDNYVAGAQVKFQTTGVFESTRVLGAVGPIYMGTNGTATSLKPTTGVSLKIGYLYESKKFIIQALSRININ